MIYRFTMGSIVCFLLAAAPADLLAQFNPYSPYGSEVDPRARRAYREKAVAIVGPVARDFVETHGDEAVAAIFACSKPVAEKLAEFHAGGEMGKLPRPKDLLRVIAQPRHGDDVALWALYHAGELVDTDSFDAYLLSPLDYALGLKRIETGAAETRARRLNPAVTIMTRLTDDQKLAIYVGLGLLAIVALVLWRRRQSTMY